MYLIIETDLAYGRLLAIEITEDVVKTLPALFNKVQVVHEDGFGAERQFYVEDQAVKFRLAKNEEFAPLTTREEALVKEAESWKSAYTSQNTEMTKLKERIKELEASPQV